MITQHDIHQVLWHPVILEPVPMLATLRHTVLSINPKRCPRWRFRFANDLVVQIQPRPVDRRTRFTLFAGIAIQGAGITLAQFTAKGRRYVPGLEVMAFSIELCDGRWAFVLRSAPAGPEWASPFMVFEERVVHGMASFRQLHGAMLFSPACLLCGRALTDPVSMARGIGPECYGSHGLEVGLFALPDDRVSSLPGPRPGGESVWTTCTSCRAQKRVALRWRRGADGIDAPEVPPCEGCGAPVWIDIPEWPALEEHGRATDGHAGGGS
jgi:hypothetical protein